MKSPISFTGAVIRRMLADPDMAETVHYWTSLAISRTDQEIQFAGQLHDDFLAGFPFDNDDAENTLLADMIRLADMRVNWRAVAAFLLARFADPKFGYWRPMAWQASRN
jgi:hypothetical protein